MGCENYQQNNLDIYQYEKQKNEELRKECDGTSALLEIIQRNRDEIKRLNKRLKEANDHNGYLKAVIEIYNA